MFETLILRFSRASGDDQGNRATAGTAVRVGAKLLRALIDGSYGEQVSVSESCFEKIYMGESKCDVRTLQL